MFAYPRHSGKKNLYIRQRVFGHYPLYSGHNSRDRGISVLNTVYSSLPLTYPTLDIGLTYTNCCDTAKQR